MLGRRFRLIDNGVGKFLVLLALGVGGSASAIDVKVTGDLNNRVGVYTDQAPLYRASETIGAVSTPGAVVQQFPIGESWAEIKYRLGGVFATDDQKVKGVLALEWGSIRFGDNPALGCTVTGVTGSTPVCVTGGSVNKNAGGSFSGDGVNTELRFAYTDFALPTSFKSNVTFGLQPFATNKYLWQETATGIQLKGSPGDVGMTVAWMRGIEFFNTNRNDKQFADADNIMARLDIGTVPNVKGGLFYLYQHRQPNNATRAPIAHLLKNFGAANYNINNIGLDGSVTAGPVFASIDAIYQTGTITNTTGSSSATAVARGNFDLSSFFAHADLGVKLGPAKVTYTGRYASGDTNRGDGTIRNFIATDVDINDSIIFNEGGLTDDVYFTEAPYFLDKGSIFNKLALDVVPVEKLTLGVYGAYVMTAEELTLAAGGAKTKDLGVEVGGSISYVLYDGLTLAMNAGYLFASDGMDFFEVNKNGKKDHDIFRATAGIRYRFGTGPI